MVMCIYCNRSSFDIYSIDCAFFFFFDIVQYWGGWKTQLQLFAFLLPKPSHMTSQEFFAFAQQGPYLSRLQWESEQLPKPNEQNLQALASVCFSLSSRTSHVHSVAETQSLYMFCLANLRDDTSRELWMTWGAPPMAQGLQFVNHTAGGRGGTRGRHQKGGPPLILAFSTSE